MITITLSKKQLNTDSTGYQPPLPVEQVKPLVESEDGGEGSPMKRGRERGGPRRGKVTRGRGIYSVSGEFYGDGWDGGRAYGIVYGGSRGRGRAGGRTYRGQGRGYGSQSVGYHDDGGYEAAVPATRGRGRGRSTRTQVKRGV